ncbi:hypothetical protein SAMN05192561_1225 [Halopenitus malekzadehii]|uniref:Uncharacterized protein n=1 Tax=Halopenitus malekzadehii TaxID=1267564 RepID=A0A1H6JSL6_9EURY|nr:hypothetical protein [Halopenitus malekzadehii]SEH65503.1 hypothetical protein SAMN05192561_1225 [Halopenitus malekzadehii]
MNSGSQWLGEYAAQIGTASFESGETFTVRDPATGAEIASVTEGKSGGIDRLSMLEFGGKSPALVFQMQTSR